MCADPPLIPVGPDGVLPLSRFGLACKRLVTRIDACPSAATSQQWLGHVFNAPCGVELIREFTAREIYPFLFPPTTRHPFEPFHPQCRICQQYDSEIRQWVPVDPFPSMPVPQHRGSLHTSRGAGLDGIVAELIRWFRPEDFRDGYDYRMAVCSLIS